MSPLWGTQKRPFSLELGLFCVRMRIIWGVQHQPNKGFLNLIYKQ